MYYDLLRFNLCCSDLLMLVALTCPQCKALGLGDTTAFAKTLGFSLFICLCVAGNVWGCCSAQLAGIWHAKTKHWGQRRLLPLLLKHWGSHCSSVRGLLQRTAGWNLARQIKALGPTKARAALTCSRCKALGLGDTTAFAQTSGFSLFICLCVCQKCVGLLRRTAGWNFFSSFWAGFLPGPEAALSLSLRVGSAPSALSTLPTQREREREQPLAQGESQPKKRKKRKKRKKLVKTHAKRGKKQMVRKTEEEKKEKMKT